MLICFTNDQEELSYFLSILYSSLEIFTNKRMTSEKHLMRNDPNKFSWKMQNQESFIIRFLPFPLYANSLPVVTSSIKLKDKS